LCPQDELGIVAKTGKTRGQDMLTCSNHGSLANLDRRDRRRKYAEHRSLACYWSFRIYRRDGRSLRHVQRSRLIKASRAGSYVEQCLVFALRLRSDQLHEKLGLRWLCSDGFMDWRVSFYDMAAQTGTIEKSAR